MAYPHTDLLQNLFKEAESFARQTVLLKPNPENPSYQKFYGEGIDKLDKAMTAYFGTFATTAPVEKTTLVLNAEQECRRAMTKGRFIPKDVAILLPIMEKLVETCIFSVGHKEEPHDVWGQLSRSCQATVAEIKRQIAG